MRGPPDAATTPDMSNAGREIPSKVISGAVYCACSISRSREKTMTWLAHMKSSMIRDYFNSLAESLAVNSKSASFGQHRPDTGANREDLLIALLNRHLPDRLKEIAGGK